jgi:hypothetical protein
MTDMIIAGNATDAQLIAVEPEREWIFTFGSGHRGHSHGSRVGHDLTAEGFRLDDRYVRIVGTYDSARAQMMRWFGQVWSMQYASPDDAGVDDYKLTELVLTADWRSRS